MALEQVFGTNVRRLRKIRGLTQEALAHDPTLSVVERFAAALMVSAVDLLIEAPPSEDD